MKDLTVSETIKAVNSKKDQEISQIESQNEQKVK